MEAELNLNPGSLLISQMIGRQAVKYGGRNLPCQCRTMKAQTFAQQNTMTAQYNISFSSVSAVSKLF